MLGVSPVAGKSGVHFGIEVRGKIFGVGPDLKTVGCILGLK